MITLSPCRDDLHDSQFKIDLRELDICAMQGPSLPQDEPIDRRAQEVVITKGHYKGYYGRIKDVGREAVTIELEPLMGGSDSPLKLFKWDQFMPR